MCCSVRCLVVSSHNFQNGQKECDFVLFLGDDDIEGLRVIYELGCGLRRRLVVVVLGMVGKNLVFSERG